MTERDEYTPSVDEAREAYANGVWRFDHYMAVGRAEFDRMIEAVRQEEREKAAQIADRLHGVGNDIIASRIREGR